MRVYKLTDQEGYTRRGQKGETKWGENITHKVDIPGTDLCTDQVIHYYDNPYLGLFMNPAHTNLENPLVWEADIPESAVSDKTKGGAKELTTIRKVVLEEPTVTQRVAFGILCSLTTLQLDQYQEWANSWLSGRDRTAASATSAANAAYAAAYTAAYAAYSAASAAAYAAAYAAYTAAAYAAASAAASAAAYAPINLSAIAEKAMEY